MVRQSSMESVSRPKNPQTSAYTELGSVRNTKGDSWNTGVPMRPAPLLKYTSLPPKHLSTPKWPPAPLPKPRLSRTLNPCNFSDRRSDGTHVLTPPRNHLQNSDLPPLRLVNVWKRHVGETRPVAVCQQWVRANTFKELKDALRMSDIVRDEIVTMKLGYTPADSATLTQGHYSLLLHPTSNAHAGKRDTTCPRESKSEGIGKPSGRILAEMDKEMSGLRTALKILKAQSQESNESSYPKNIVDDCLNRMALLESNIFNVVESLKGFKSMETRLSALEESNTQVLRDVSNIKSSVSDNQQSFLKNVIETSENVNNQMNSQCTQILSVINQNLTEFKERVGSQEPEIAFMKMPKTFQGNNFGSKECMSAGTKSKCALSLLKINQNLLDFKELASRKDIGEPPLIPPLPGFEDCFGFQQIGKFVKPMDSQEFRNPAIPASLDVEERQPTRIELDKYSPSLNSQ